MALLEPEFRPSAALCDGRVDCVLFCGGADFSGDFDFLTVVVETVRYGGLDAGFGVDGRDGLREFGGIFSIAGVVGPVGSVGREVLVRGV